MTVFQMSDSDTKDDKYGPTYRARKQRRRSHVTEASQQALVEAKRVRHQRLLERQHQREACDDAQRVAAESTPVMPEWVPWNDGAPCESDESNYSSDETSESSTGFETEAAVSVVAPAAMQRPPTRKELDNDGHIGKFMVYLTVPESNPASSNSIPSVVLAEIKGIRRDDAKLSYNVFDFSCNQDQAHLLTITDGHWDVARTHGRGRWNLDPARNYCTEARATKKYFAATKEQRAIMGRPKCWDERRPVKLPEDKPNWIDVVVNLVVCILPRVTSGIIISHGGYMLSGTSSLIESLLRASTHAHAVAFVESGKRERRKLTSNTIVEEKQKIFTDGPPRFPCGVKSCPAVFRWTYQANEHMQYHHALGPDDPLLIRKAPNSRVCGKYPCRFVIPGEDPCEFRSFKKKTSANQHMQTSHGLLSGDNHLY
jgi:hypothetical protein